MKKDWAVVSLLFLLTIPAIRDLFIPGGFTSHDLTHHVLRQISMDKLLSEGQFPPRWSGELNNGYGYPVFLFNYPLPAMVGEVFHQLGFNFVDSVKAVLIFSMVLSVVGMYLFLKALLNSKMASFLGSLFYLYAPIRFLIVYVSATVGFALAAGIITFVFWTITKISQSMSLWYILAGGLSLAALITSHNVSTIIFAPAILGFAALMVWQAKERVRVLRGLGVMCLLGLGLSAWFWLPASLEKTYIRYEEVMARFYVDQYPTISQLIRSPWGYGFAKPEGQEDGISFQVGLVHLLVIAGLVGGLGVLRGFREVRRIGGFSLILFALSIFLMLKVSLPLWGHLPLLEYIQFPYRILILSVFSASLAAALLIKVIPWKWPVFIILLVLVIYANRNHWHINQVFAPTEEYYLTQKPTTSSYGEHLPKWGKIATSSAAKIEVVEGLGNIMVIGEKSDEVVAEVKAEGTVKLRLNQYYFPEWQIKVSGSTVKFDPYSADSLGLPVFEVPSGTYLIEAKFINTPIRNLADKVGLITLLIYGSMVGWKLLPRNLLRVKKSS